MLEDMTKGIMGGFGEMTKIVSDALREKGTSSEQRTGSLDPAHVENPQISQPDYISAYRDALRKHTGIEPFIGFDTQLRGDNLGSYI